MNKLFIIITLLSISSFAILQSQTDGEKIGEVRQIDKNAGEVMVGSSSAGRDIKMGDLLYLRIDGKVIRLRATFPMMTIVKCKAEGKNKSLWIKAEKGMSVYRYKNGIENDNISVEPEIYKIGSRGPAGGWIFYDKGNSEGGWRYMEAALEDQADDAEWGCYKKTITGAKHTSIGSGRSNTLAIMKGCGEKNIAAKIAAAYRGGDKTDWFLPSSEELNEIYINLHKSGVGDFNDFYYWSSSEDNADLSHNQNFYLGDQKSDNKNVNFRVRAVRMF